MESRSQTIPALPAERTESEFLSDQARYAQAAIKKELGRVGEQLERLVDPRAWAEDHPWATSGAAIVAGFVAASILVPSKEEQELSRLAKFEKFLMPKPPRTVQQEQTASTKQGEKNTLKNTLLHHALDLVKPILTTVLMSKLSQSIDQNHNGQTPEQAAQNI